MLEASAGGALVDKTPMAAKTLIANRALNAQQYEGVCQKDNPRQQQVNEVVEKPKEQSVTACGVCSMKGHLTDKCPQLIENGGWESTNAVGFGSQNQSRNDPFSNTYNPGQENQAKDMHNYAKEVQNQDREVTELKRQMGQMAEFMGQFSREPGKLPSSTDVNPKGGFESVKAITLKSGKEVGTDPQPSKSAQTEDEKLEQEEDVQHTPTTRKETTLSCTPPLPNPSNLSTTGKKDLGASINVMPYSVYASMNLRELKHDGVVIQLANRSNAYPKGVLDNVLVQVDHLIFLANFYVLDMEDAAHSPPPSILLRRPFMKTAQTKIDVAKGALTMAFGGDMIHFKIPESNVNLTDVRSCFAIDVVENIGQQPSAPTKKDELTTTNEEKIGVEHKEHTTNLQMHNLAESTFGKSVDSAATSLQHIGKPPIPSSIPISTNRLLPCMVQVPNRIQAGGNDYIDLRMLNAPIGKDYYPLPFIEPMY
ncbi:unnamed protein product [Malus baccata var. baccata]